jgi:hypothetical protein
MVRCLAAGTCLHQDRSAIQQGQVQPAAPRAPEEMMLLFQLGSLLQGTTSPRRQGSTAAVTAVARGGLAKAGQPQQDLSGTTQGIRLGG